MEKRCVENVANVLLQHNKQNHRKLLLSSFHVNSQTYKDSIQRLKS